MQSYLESCQKLVNDALLLVLPQEHLQPYDLHKAMRYAVLNGGKRLRSAFVYALGESLAVEKNVLDDIAMAVELIHAFSLIHDDLPALDNDDLRRGKPTCHKVFGEATAILAGDALQSLAFEVLTGLKLPPEKVLPIIRVLARATGSQGMTGGETLDIGMVNSRVSVHELEYMYQLKTGALFGAGMIMVAIAAGSDAIILSDISNFAENLGIAFQIHDDIIGIESDTATLGKRQQADLAANKPVYPVITGMAEAKQRRDALFEEALACLATLKIENTMLKDLCHFVVARNY